MLITEMRWYKSVDDENYRLQFRNGTVNGGQTNYGEWQDVPFVLEGKLTGAGSSRPCRAACYRFRGNFGSESAPFYRRRFL